MKQKKRKKKKKPTKEVKQRQKGVPWYQKPKKGEASSPSMYPDKIVIDKSIKGHQRHAPIKVGNKYYYPHSGYPKRTVQNNDFKFGEFSVKRKGQKGLLLIHENGVEVMISQDMRYHKKYYPEYKREPLRKKKKKRKK